MADRRGALLRAVPPALAALGLLLAPFSGGFDGARFYPALIVVAWALAASWWWSAPVPRSPAVRIGLVAYGTLCLWGYASILWSPARADALAAADRTTLYGLVLLLALRVPWAARTGRAVLGLVAAGGTAVALGTLAVAALSHDPSRLFLDGRLSAPAGYPNATAELWLLALWPALFVAVGGPAGGGADGRGGHGRAASAGGGAGDRLVESVALAAAGLLMQAALLAQSRGALVAFAVAAIVYVAVAPRRGGVLLALGTAAVATAATAPTLLAVADATSTAELGGRLHRAVLAMTISAVALAVARAAWAALLARLPRGVAGTLGSPRTGAGAAGVLAVAAVVAVALAVGNPSTWAHARWRDFRSGGYTAVDRSGTRLGGSLGSDRYDFYRVALDEARAHPIAGTGLGGFSIAYLEHRRSAEAPRYAHSLALGTLAELGVLGLALLAVFALALLWAVGSARRRAGPAGTAMSAAALAAVVSFAIHGSIDWLWEFPALGILAAVLLATAARSGAEPGDRPQRRVSGAGPWGGAPPWHAPVTRAITLVGLVAVTFAAASLGLAAHSLTVATSAAGSDPPAALADYARAARLDPFDSGAPVRRGIVARRAGLPGTWRADAADAVRRQPDSWFARLELGMAEAQAGHRAAALAQLARAHALDPSQAAVPDVIAAVRDGTSFSPDAVEARIDGQLDGKLQALRAPSPAG